MNNILLVISLIGIGYIIYQHKKYTKEEIIIQDSIVKAFEIIDEKIDCILKETDDLLNKLDK